LPRLDVVGVRDGVEPAVVVGRVLDAVGEGAILQAGSSGVAKVGASMCLLVMTMAVWRRCTGMAWHRPKVSTTEGTEDREA